VQPHNGRAHKTVSDRTDEKKDKQASQALVHLADQVNSKQCHYCNVQP